MPSPLTKLQPYHYKKQFYLPGIQSKQNSYYHFSTCGWPGLFTCDLMFVGQEREAIKSPYWLMDIFMLFIITEQCIL